MLTPEIPPLYGTLVAFRRADNSFHGHLPFEGERRVIQFAWLADRDALERKTQRGHMQRLFKRVFGPLDRWLGARRDVNKAHRDWVKPKSAFQAQSDGAQTTSAAPLTAE